LGLIGGTVKIMDEIYAKREAVARLEERVRAVEAQNNVYESIIRKRFELDYGPIATEDP